MKSKKVQIIYRDPKKLLSFKKAGKPASFKPSFKAATRLS